MYLEVKVKSDAVKNNIAQKPGMLGPWTVVRQTPLSMGFSRQEYLSGLPSPPGDLPAPEIEPSFLVSPALKGGFFTTRHHL